MAPKKITKEIVILLVVIGCALLFMVLQKNQHTNYSIPSLETLDQKGLTKILIEKNDERIEIQFADGNWTLAPKGYALDKEKVQKALDTLCNIQLSELISKTGNEAMYDLTPEKRIRVSLYKETELLRQLDLGKASSSYRHTFVRLKEGKEVYQAVGSFRNDLDLKSDDWRNKQVFKLDQNEVTHLKFAPVGQEFVFEKSVKKAEQGSEPSADGSGQGPKPPVDVVAWNAVPSRKEPQKNGAIDSVINKLLDLRCDRFAPEGTVLGEVDYVLNIQAAQPHTLTFYKPEKEDASDILVTSSQSPYPFLLSKWSADSLKKQEKDLFEIPEEPKEVKK